MKGGLSGPPFFNLYFVLVIKRKYDTYRCRGLYFVSQIYFHRLTGAEEKYIECMKRRCRLIFCREEFAMGILDDVERLGIDTE